MRQLAIRPAGVDEAVGCRAVVPQAFPPGGSAPELFVASAAGGEIAGVAAMAWVPGGFPVLVRVGEPWRRQGIGRALLQAAITAAAGETPALRAWGPLGESCPEALLLQAAGFRTTRRLLVFETDAVRFRADMTALLDRLRAAGRVPRDVRLATLADAPAAEVISLVAGEFAASPYDVASRIAAGAANGYDPALSLVLARGAAVVGAMLCRRSGDVAEIDVNVVTPELRRGWANVLLLEGMARRCHVAGVVQFRFSCEEHVRDTLNLAQRSGARQLPTQVLLALALGGDGSA
jgi:GNAT superfamily N-acetyltransferase